MIILKPSNNSFPNHTYYTMNLSEPKMYKNWLVNGGFNDNWSHITKWINNNEGNFFRISLTTRGKIRYGFASIHKSNLALGLNMDHNIVCDITYYLKNGQEQYIVDLWAMDIIMMSTKRGICLGHYHGPDKPNKQERERIAQWRVEVRIQERARCLIVLDNKLQQDGGLMRFITEYI